MDTAKNEYAKVLETIQHIRKQAGGELEIPQICVLGDQSSGKSTWLSSVVSGLKGVLPAGRGTVTLCPIVVHVRCGESRHVVIRNTGQKIQTDTTDWQKTARTALEELMKKVTSSSDSEYEDGYSTSSEGTGQPPIHVSKEEITVEYSAPDVQDLVLVDLPGLIQAGPFVDDIEKMARKYINPVSTLIVITREADLDPDRAAAVRLANEADPDGDRTMVVLTKCDIFSNDEGRKAVLKEISNQNSPDVSKNDSLAIHLTCCDPQDTTEDDYFKFNNFNDYQNVGSKDLADRRLPSLLAGRILGCKQNLVEQIYTKLEQSRKFLRQAGRCQKNQDIICSEFVSHVCEVVNMEQLLSPLLPRLSDVKIEAEWTNERHEPNLFKPSFYQGLTSFDRCIKDASDEFMRPCAETLCTDVRNLLDTIPEKVFQNYHHTSHDLESAFKLIWLKKKNEIMDTLCKRTEDIIDSESRFATMNDHYLQVELLRQFFTPDSVVASLANAIEDHHVSFEDRHDKTLLYSKDRRSEKLRNIFNNILNHHFTTVVKSQAEEFQQRHLHAAVKAHWKVSRKRFCDNMMQTVRDVVIKDGWLAFCHALNGLEEIKNSCKEPDTVKQDRTFNIELEENMESCLKLAQALPSI